MIPMPIRIQYFPFVTENRQRVFCIQSRFYVPRLNGLKCGRPILPMVKNCCDIRCVSLMAANCQSILCLAANDRCRKRHPNSNQKVHVQLPQESNAMEVQLTAMTQVAPIRIWCYHSSTRHLHITGSLLATFMMQSVQLCTVSGVSIHVP